MTLNNVLKNNKSLHYFHQFICRRVASNTTAVCEESGLQNYLFVLMLGMIFHGVGGATLYTVGVAYLDDSVDATRSPLYLGRLPFI